MSDRSNDDEGTTEVKYRGTGFYVSVVVIIVTAVVLLVFAVQNTADVGISFLGFDATVPLFAVVIGAALATVVMDQLIGLVWRWHKRHRLAEKAELQRLRRQVKPQDEKDAAEREASEESESQHAPS